MNREVTFTMKDMIRQGVLIKLVAGESAVAQAAAAPAELSIRPRSNRGHEKAVDFLKRLRYTFGIFCLFFRITEGNEPFVLF